MDFVRLNRFAHSLDKEEANKVFAVVACTRDRRWQVDFLEHGAEPSTRETTTLPRLLRVKGYFFANVLLYRRLI
jgi:hypothetical protein